MAKELITKQEKKEIEEVLETVLTKLELDKEFNLTVNEENLEIVLKTQDTGIVIGKRGEVLDSLQTLLSVIFSRKTGKFIPVSLEVGDYRKNRTDWLFNLAENIKEQVLNEGREIALPNLKPWERRIVHLKFQDDKEVVTESIGEGQERTLVIRPR